MTSEKILGIDLGTTHSAVAIIEGASPEIIENERGNRVTPSVVAYKPTDNDDEHDEWLVGEAAASQEANNPDGTKRSFKRDMGDDITYELHDTEVTPVELSAKILRSLKEDAQRFLGIPEEQRDKDMKAVITVPAYFSSPQRRATREAAEIAGLECLETFDEPTSAALAYARREARMKEDDDAGTETRNLLVFDLGGGTLDVTVMEYGGAIDNVLSTSGNTNLGGDDWDTALTDHLAGVIEDDTDTNPIEDDDVGLTPKIRLKDAAREAKEDLSDAKEVTINLPFLFPTDDDGVYTFEYSLTRAEFEDATTHLLEQIVEPVRNAIDQAASPKETHKPSDFNQTDIDDVLLVGGSTRMPQIQEKVEHLVNQPPTATINPDEVVGKGAAYKAGSHSGEVTGVTLLDIVPLSIGLKVRNGLFERVIPKNKTRPIEVTKTFTTAAANQTSVNIEVFQGEREIADENDRLGDFVLSGIPPAPAGTPQINVTFSVDDDGILSVKAEESVTGVDKEVTLNREHGLSQDDIDRLKREAEEHAQHDDERRQKIHIRNDAEKAVQRANTLLDKQGDAISPDLEERIVSAREEVEKYLDLIRNGDSPVDYDTVRQTTSELNTEIEQIGRDVYQPDDAYQDETIDVESPEKDSKSAVPRQADDDDDSDESTADNSETDDAE